MKTKKLLLIGALTLSAFAAPLASFANSAPVHAETVTIKNTDPTDTTVRDYKVYQIFEGSVGPDGSIGNLEWANPSGATQLLNELAKEFTDAGFTTSSTAQDVASYIAEGNNDRAVKFSKVLANNKGSLKSINVTFTSNADASLEGKIENPGYYLLVDETTNVGNEVQGLPVLRIIGDDSSLEVNPKNGKPTVDKQVKDEVDGGTGNIWGETADHSIGEEVEFRFYSPIEWNKIKNYNTYSLTFTDNMTNIDYIEGSAKVEVISKANSENLEVDWTASESDNLTSQFTISKTGNTLSVSISDLINALPSSYKVDDSEFKIVVTYKGKLTESAVVNSTDENGNVIGNKNDVKLTYSNNPNGTGTGETAPDTVFVGTFKLPNTKFDGSSIKKDADGNELLDAQGNPVRPELGEAVFAIKNGAGQYAKIKQDGDRYVVEKFDAKQHH